MLTLTFAVFTVCELVAFTDKRESAGTFQSPRKSTRGFFASSWFLFRPFTRQHSAHAALMPARGWSFRTLFSDKVECEEVKSVWKSTAWSHQADCRGNEGIGPLTHAPPRTHLYLLPPHAPLRPFLLIQPGAGIALIIQKVTCGLLLSPHPSFSLFSSLSSARRKWKGGGNSQRESRSWSFLSSP